jgi:hypothetical protein
MNIILASALRAVLFCLLREITSVVSLANGEGKDSGTNCPPSDQLLEIMRLDERSRSSDWWQRYDFELERGSSLVFDRLGPFSGLEIQREGMRRRSGIVEFIDSRGKSAIFRAVENSVQETALAIVPLEELFKGLTPEERLSDISLQLVRGAFGYTAEKEIPDLPVSYSLNETSWKRELYEERRAFLWGIRPRMSPYLFGVANIGHFDERPALALEGRVRYRAFDRMLVSATASVPLPGSFELSLGAACEPLRLNHRTTAAMRFQRALGLSVIFAGFEYNESEHLFLCGFMHIW